MNYRDAVLADLPQLVALLADDALGATREKPERPLDERYLNSFAAIEKDPHNQLIVMELKNRQGKAELVGTLQLTYIPYLNRLGTWRCLIEGVRIHKKFRGQGKGRAAFLWAIEQARNKGCGMLQLTSDKQRPEALRFYESLGFRASHEGFKLFL